MFQDIATLAEDLAAGRTTSRALTEEALARIEDPTGQGKRVFLKVHRDQALASADAMDKLLKAGIRLSPLAGQPVSIKDLFDIAGEATPAGSVVLKDAPPAAQDAPAVARLRAAGGVIVGRTNMTEFAMSGLGLNPHYGTPLSPWDRKTGRISGGSSSGAAVSVTDGMAVAGLGTDTAASCRVPAAFCGITGYKPTARRVPTAGAIPLSTTLDSIGSLARTVRCVATMDAILAGQEQHDTTPIDARRLRIGVPQTLVLDNLDAPVAQSFSRALGKLSAAGIQLVDIPFAELGRLPEINRFGGFSTTEAWAWHRKLIAEKGDRYDPIIAGRMRRGGEPSAADYIDLVNARAEMIELANAATAQFDAVVMPTVAMAPPELGPLEKDEQHWLKTNMLVLRNTLIGNFLDRCAISLPCHRPGDAPVGLMLMGETMGDGHLFRVARTVEGILGFWKAA